MTLNNMLPYKSVNTKLFLLGERKLRYTVCFSSFHINMQIYMVIVVRSNKNTKALKY